MNDDLNPCPNLIIMGAQKSGTTSLYEYLKVHPDIFMSNPVKEPGFFLGEERAKIFWERNGDPIESRYQLLHERMLEGYQGEFWFGDASTYYTIGRRSRLFHIPDRMHAENPDMRFIYILRNPVERILSNYHHSRTKGRCKGSLQDFLNSEEGPSAVLTSRYWYQLEAYLEVFRPEQFHLVVFEEFLEQPHHSMTEVWRFLDLPEPPEAPKFVTHNAGNRENPDVGNDRHGLEHILSVLRADTMRLEHWLGRNIRAWSSMSFVP